MKSANSPIVSSPAITSRPPKRSTAAIPSDGRKRRPGRKYASTDAARIVSCRTASARPRKRVRTSSSRPNACTISIPTTASSVASARLPLRACTSSRDREEPVREDERQDRDRRHRKRRVEREPRVHGGEDDRRADDHHRALDALDDAPADEVAHGVDVVRRARDHLARRVPVEEGARIREVRVVEHPAQPRLDGDPDPGGREAAAEVDDEAQRRQQDDRAEIGQQQLVVRRRRSRRRRRAGSGAGSRSRAR